MAIEARQLFNFIQGSDITGESAYDVWKRLGNEGSEADFLEFIRSGPKGENAHIYALAVSDPVMKKGANNALLPVNTTFTGYYRIGAEATRYDYAGRFIIEETKDGTIWETKYTSETDEVSVMYVPSNVDVKIIKCTLYAAGGTTTEIDTQTVVILEDVAGLKVGARNLLSNSDIRYTFTKDSSEAIDMVSIVNDFDLQRLVNETVTLSFYADTMGSFTNADDGTNETSNRFGMIAKLVWSDSTGAMGDKLTETPLELEAVGVNKERVFTTHEIIAPAGYDTIDSFTFDIVLSMKPGEDNEGTWVFERPKLEVGNIPTEWTLAPEDVKHIQDANVQSDLNQNDESAPDYIKNRTHYIYEGKVADEVLFDNDVTYSKYHGLAYLEFQTPLPITEGNEYLVQFEDESVIVTCGVSTVPGIEQNIGSSIDLNSDQISIMYYASLLLPEITHLKISTIKMTDVVVPLEDKFIPDTILRFDIEETLELPDVTLEVSDDGNGNVTANFTGVEITDDGNGNVSITSEHMTITDDGNGNVNISV